MQLHLTKVNPFDGYDSSSVDGGLVYYSASYGAFLQDALAAKSNYLLAGTPSAPVGLLPMLVKEGPLGPVANALPFFGSHGAPVTEVGNESLVEDLLNVVESGIQDNRWAAVTLVENPLKPIDERLVRGLRYLRPIDERISQVTYWTDDPPEDLEGLFHKFHVKHRNAIRKGLATGQEVRLTSSTEDWEYLISQHEIGIGRLGGMSKSREVFEALRKHLSGLIRLHCGYTNGRRTAALLSLRYGSTIEYFVPVVDLEWRNSQVLPHLVAAVMLSDIQDGVSAWNWGGTWNAQSGVFRFKNRFGATNRPYRYFHWCNGAVASAEPSYLLKSYPYWYTRLFHS